MDSLKEEIRGTLPEIKKSLSNFVKDENGLISKDNILKLGVATGIAAVLLTSTVHADHTEHSNTISGNFDSSAKTLTGTHTHVMQHSSY